MSDKQVQDKLDILNYYVSDGIIILISLVGIMTVSYVLSD